MTVARAALACSRVVALRLLAAGALLFAQIVGAALVGASLGGTGSLELCVGRGTAALVAVDPDDPRSDQRGSEFCAGCLVGCCRAPLPGLAGCERCIERTAAEPPLPLVRVAAAAVAPRALRPPGRAPPARS